jgi:hypothetical protein
MIDLFKAKKSTSLLWAVDFASFRFPNILYHRGGVVNPIFASAKTLRRNPFTPETAQLKGKMRLIRPGNTLIEGQTSIYAFVI